MGELCNSASDAEGERKENIMSDAVSMRRDLREEIKRDSSIDRTPENPPKCLFAIPTKSINFWPEASSRPDKSRVPRPEASPPSRQTEVPWWRGPQVNTHSSTPAVQWTWGCCENWETLSLDCQKPSRKLWIIVWRCGETHGSERPAVQMPFTTASASLLQYIQSTDLKLAHAWPQELSRCL